MSSLHVTDPERTHSISFNCMCFLCLGQKQLPNCVTTFCQCEEIYIFKFDICKFELVNPILGQRRFHLQTKLLYEFHTE